MIDIIVLIVLIFGISMLARDHNIVRNHLAKLIKEYGKHDDKLS